MPQGVGIATPRVALWVGFMVLVTSAIDSATAQQRSEGEETPAGILAVRLREQGYRCDEPARAHGGADPYHESVWGMSHSVQRGGRGIIK